MSNNFLSALFTRFVSSVSVTARPTAAVPGQSAVALNPVRAVMLAIVLVALVACGGGGNSTPVQGSQNAGDQNAGGADEPTALTGNSGSAQASAPLLTMGGEWLTWSNEPTGITQDAETGYLVLPAVSAGQDYIYGVRSFPVSLTAGGTYRLQLVSQDTHAKVLMFLRDVNGFNLPLTESSGAVKDLASVSGPGTLSFVAPSGVTSVLLQVQAGWRSSQETRLLVSLNESALPAEGGSTNDPRATNSLLNLGGSWDTWDGTDSGIYYDASAARLVLPAVNGQGHRVGVQQFDLALDPANEYTVLVDASNAAATARVYLAGDAGRLNFVHANTGLSRDWHEASNAEPLRFTPPAGVTRVTIQVQGPWQAVDATMMGLSLAVSGAGSATPPVADNGVGDDGGSSGEPVSGNNTDSTAGDTGSDGGNTGTGNGANAGDSNNGATGSRPRVAIITDINYSGGDPDDSQSMIHVMWYADELDIRAIIPDKWSGGGYQATMDALAAYESDYYAYGMSGKGYPAPSTIRGRVSSNAPQAINSLIREADASSEPLYVLIWGAMTTLRDALYQRPDLAAKFRVLTIASAQHYNGNCSLPNWNAGGRDDIFNDSRFNNMWWVESNWTYNGMFDGPRPVEMLNTMTGYGTMGWKMKDVVSAFSWAQYFRAGDTPTVLYLIDPSNNLDNPTQGSWAGQFTRPLPSWKPNYYADSAGGAYWDYANPCNSWGQKTQVYNHAKSTLEWQRESMYSALLGKLNWIYGR